jgi:prophage antirepressor-like protein
MNEVIARNEEVQVFNNEVFGEIRTIMIDGEVWFVARDIIKALEIKDSAYKFLLKVDDEDKGQYPFPSAGGNQLSSIVNESGLYTLIMRSNKPEAKPFQRWVTKEVLPTIRKTGGYVQENRAIDFVNAWLPQIDDTTKNIIAGTLEQNQKLVVENRKLVTAIEEQAPKVEKYRELLDTDGTMNPTTLKDFLGFKSPQALNKWLKEQGIQYKKGGSWNIRAKYSYLIKEGYAKVVTNTVYNNKQIRWYPKGLDFLKDLKAMNEK